MHTTAPVVLLATSDSHTHELFRPALARHGASVVCATTEEGAVQGAYGLLPVAIIADLGTSTVNAMVVRERLRSDARTRHIPILIVRGSAETWRRAVELAVVLATKSQEQLLSSIGSILSTGNTLPTC